MIFTWKIGGDAGQGQQVAGLILAKICSQVGLESFVYSEYPSLLRGGLVTNQVNLSGRPVEANYQKIDLLFALNQEALDLNVKNLNKNALVFYNSDKVQSKNKKFHALPINELLKDLNKQAANSLILGLTASLLNLDQNLLKKEFKDTFKGKKEELIEQNEQAAEIGWQYAQEIKSNFNLKQGKPSGKLILTGNEAVALGAVAGGCQFYAAYPMTPATSILHNLAKWASQANMIVKHTEDEISAVNMAIGASWGGVRAMVGTSGGGFALMNEGLALSGITETPLVIVDAQRPGPATGLPTWTGQEDLQYVAKAGHGEFPRIVLAPGSVQEAFSLTVLAFNLSDQYQIPVFILIDKYLSESYQTVSLEEAKIEKGSVLNKVNKNYKRYLLTKDGVSPRTLPGMKDGMFVSNSDEHDEYGYSIEGFDDQMREKQVEKRFKKNFFKDLPKPKLYGSKKAKTTLVGWGSVMGSVLEAIKDTDANYLHFSVPYPLKVKELPENAIVIENNYTGQFANLLQESLGKKFKRKNKYNGRQFTPEEIRALILKK